MANIFSNLTSEGHEEVKDVLGGSFIRDTGVYDAIIKLAYAGKSASSESRSVTVHLEIDGKEYRETLWITNKEGINSYKDAKGKTQSLPGFVTIDHLCLLSTGLPLANQEMEEKVIMLYDFEQKKDMPKNAMVITSILNKPVTVAINKNKVDITKKNDTTGNYDPTGETKFENTISKVFHTETGKTTVEFRKELPAEFKGKWLALNGPDKVFDKTSKAGNNGKAGAPGAKPVQGDGARNQTSLFNKG